MICFSMIQLAIHIFITKIICIMNLMMCSIGSCTKETNGTNGERDHEYGPFSGPFLDTKTDSHGSVDLMPTIHMHKKIFCNRALNMKSIVAVGFDMDYTLAQYRSDTFETLAYHGTIKKLVYDLGYPREVCNFVFNAHKSNFNCFLCSIGIISLILHNGIQMSVLWYVACYRERKHKGC